MREQVKQNIDGVEYGLYPISPFKSAPVLTRLLKIFGSSVLKMIVGAIEKDGAKKALDTDIKDLLPQMAETLDVVLEKLGEDDIEYVSKKLLAQDHFFADGKKVSGLEVHFSNHSVFHLLKVIKFSLEVNYKDFLGGNLGDGI